MPNHINTPLPLSRAQASQQEEALRESAAAEADKPRPGDRARALEQRINELVHARPAPDEAPPARPPVARARPTSSWEDIANEVAPNENESPRRGLATGAMRAGSRPNPNAKADPAYRPTGSYIAPPAAPRAIECRLPAPHELLLEALEAEELTSYAHGRHLRVSRDAAHYDDAFANLKQRFQKVLECEGFPVLSGANAADVVFMDIETTGLSSTSPLFLIGALGMLGEPRLELFLARSRAEEKATLAAYHEMAHGKWLITFNGIRFDWPYIEGRSRHHRLSFAQPRGHFDLLHHARRQWKHNLPNCKLQTLELHLCGRTRHGDVPGSQIPSAYHEFAAHHASTGRGADLMAPILHHNALDILTMAELVCMAGEELG